MEMGGRKVGANTRKTRRGGGRGREKRGAECDLPAFAAGDFAMKNHSHGSEKIYTTINVINYDYNITSYYCTVIYTVYLVTVIS